MTDHCRKCTSLRHALQPQALQEGLQLRVSNTSLTWQSYRKCRVNRESGRRGNPGDKIILPFLQYMRHIYNYELVLSVILSNASLLAAQTSH